MRLLGTGCLCLILLCFMISVMSEEMRSKFLSGNHHHGSGEPGCWGNNPRGRGPPGPGQRPPRPEPSEDNPDLGDNDDFNDMDEKIGEN